jgi:outer membrane protein OmpA-like peptidoglycan-associated protein
MKENLVLTVRQARRRSVLVAVFIALSTGGCSSVPDAVNPVEWYKGTRDWVSGDDKVAATKQAKAKEAEAKPVPGTEKAFPTLESVPERPAQSTSAEREKMASSLIADRDAARYSSEQFRRQDSSTAASSSPPAASPRAPTPRAAPSISVPEPVQAPAAPAVQSQAMVAPAEIPARSIPVIPNQPIPVIPNQPIPVVPIPPPPVPPQPVQVPQISPPPPPVVVGNSAPPANSFPTPPLNFPDRPPVVNPSGGGPANSPPAPLTPQFFEPDQLALGFPNEAGLPQQQVLQTPSFETAQAVQPNLPPIATILFGDGSARIGSSDRQVIRQVYDEYRRRGGRIHVVGHASSRTRNLDQASHQLANFSISYERARSVAGLLERLGVPPESIVVTAMSDQEPNYFEVMPAGEAGNRRVEIFFEN